MNIDMLKYRPLPFYFLNTGDMAEYTVEKIDAKVKELYEDGFGGAILFNLADSGFDSDRYLSEEFFTVTERFILAAEKYGLKIWFTDGWRCPSGDVGGRVAARNPELYQRRLSRNGDGKVEAVKVPWGFPAFEEPESSDLFIELVYEPYFKRLGKYFGKTLQGIFSDADNRRFDAFSAGMMSDEYYPWAIDFEQKFQQEYGYDITPFLSDIIDGKHSSASYDYQRFCEKLYLNWFEKNYQWCQAHNITYTFHTSDTGPFPRSRCRRSSVFTEGNPLHFYRNCDIPGTDHELLALDGGTHFDHRLVQLKVSRGSTNAVYRTPDFANTKYDLRAKYVGSAAYLYGKSGAMSELFAAANWGATAGEFRRIAAWQMLQGVNILVPHGIHHLFPGISKYGAPPEQHYGTGGSIRELNDFISKYAFISSQGKFAPRVKVADITEAVRGGAEEVENFFTFTDMLNHAGISYVIVPADDPEAVQTLGGLPPLPERDFTFTGGDLLAMRRELDGENFLLLCNLWSEEELSGILEFEGRKIELVLAPGEMAVIGSPWEEFRTPQKFAGRSELPFPAAVNFAAPNRVPFHYNSEFTVAEEIPGGLQLLIPQEFAAGATYDGEVLAGGSTVKLMAETYVQFTVSGGVGKHSFFLPAWEKRPPDLGKPDSSTGNDPGMPADFKYYLPVCVDGEFDAALDVTGEFDHKVYLSYYILQIYDPEKCDVTLTPRRKLLTAGSWAVQGQPFYSGSAVYRFDITGYCGETVLEAPDAAVRFEAIVDGRSCGATGFPPFRIPLGDITDAQTLEIRVTNTYANEFEEYLAPSGLVKGAALLRTK